MRTLLPLLLACLAAQAETVRFETSDGIEVVADWHPAGKADAPSVICLPMYRHTRATYAPLVEPLRERGMNVLVLDLRGHGDTAPKLAERVRGRDAEVFRAMHHEVDAAARFLMAKGCDTTRIALVGASVGCSVAVDAADRYPHWVRGVVLLTPGANYLGVPTLEHLKRWPGASSLVLCAKDEEKTCRPVIDALDAAPGAASSKIHDLTGAHGTRLFGKVAGVGKSIAVYLDGKVFDPPRLAVPAWKADDPALQKPGFFRQVLGPRRKLGEGTATTMAWVVGDTWHLGVLIDTPFRGKLVLQRPGLEVPFDTAQPLKAGERKAADGTKIEVSQGSAGGKHWIELILPGEPPDAQVGLVLKPDEGEPVGLPAGKPFRALRVNR